MGPTGRHNILQIHPTRRCNLRCLHCYSNSGPDVREELEIGVLKAAVSDAASLGYSVMSVSGGEPMMYPHLRELLLATREAGMRGTLTTNGMFLDERRVEMLKECVDLVAISLDGVPDSHNAMRASEKAFSTMEAGLPALRKSGVRFGFIFTLTQHNVHELEWVAEFAANQGAALLQIHPLESAGRAKLTLDGSRPDDIEGGFAALLAAKFGEDYEGRMAVQLDLARGQCLANDPSRVYACDTGECETAMFADLVSPLVIETSGEVVPLEYGLSRHLSLGNLHEAPLRDLAPAWRATKLAEFKRICRKVFTEAAGENGPALFNWYEAVAAAAEGGVEGMAVPKPE